MLLFLSLIYCSCTHKSSLLYGTALLLLGSAFSFTKNQYQQHGNATEPCKPSVCHMLSLLCHPIVNADFLAWIDFASILLELWIELYNAFLEFEDIPPAPGVQRQELFADVPQGITSLNGVCGFTNR